MALIKFLSQYLMDSFKRLPGGEFLFIAGGSKDAESCFELPVSFTNVHLVKYVNKLSGNAQNSSEEENFHDTMENITCKDCVKTQGENVALKKESEYVSKLSYHLEKRTQEQEDLILLLKQQLNTKIITPHVVTSINENTNSIGAVKRHAETYNENNEIVLQESYSCKVKQPTKPEQKTSSDNGDETKTMAGAKRNPPYKKPANKYKAVIGSNESPSFSTQPRQGHLHVSRSGADMKREDLLKVLKSTAPNIAFELAIRLDPDNEISITERKILELQQAIRGFDHSNRDNEFARIYSRLLHVSLRLQRLRGGNGDQEGYRIELIQRCSQMIGDLNLAFEGLSVSQRTDGRVSSNGQGSRSILDEDNPVEHTVSPLEPFISYDLIDLTDGEGGIESGEVVDRFPSRGGGPLFTSSSGPRTGPHLSPQQQASRGADSLNPPDPSSQSQAHLRESVLPESRNPMFVRFAEEEDQFPANSTWSTRGGNGDQEGYRIELIQRCSQMIGDLNLAFEGLSVSQRTDGRVSSNGQGSRSILDEDNRVEHTVSPLEPSISYDLIDLTDGGGGIKSGDVVDRFPSRGGGPLFTSSSGPRTGPYPSPQQQASRGADSLNPPDPSSQSQAHLRESGIIFRMFDLIDPTDGEGGIKSGDVVDRFPSRGGGPLFTSSSGPRTGPHPSPQQQASRGADSLNPPDPSSQSQAHLRESVLPESQNPMFVRFAEEDQFLANSTWSTRFATRNQLSQLDDLTDDYSPTLADKFNNLRLQPPQGGNNVRQLAIRLDPDNEISITERKILELQQAIRGFDHSNRDNEFARIYSRLLHVFLRLQRLRGGNSDQEGYRIELIQRCSQMIGDLNLAFEGLSVSQRTDGRVSSNGQGSRSILDEDNPVEHTVSPLEPFISYDLIDLTDGEGGIESGDVVDRFPSRGGGPLFTSTSGPRTGPHLSPQQQASRGADSLNPPDPSSQSQAHLRESVLPESRNPMFVRFAEEEDQFPANSTWSTRGGNGDQEGYRIELIQRCSQMIGDLNLAFEGLSVSQRTNGRVSSNGQGSRSILDEDNPVEHTVFPLEPSISYDLIDLTDGGGGIKSGDVVDRFPSRGGGPLFTSSSGPRTGPYPSPQQQASRGADSLNPPDPSSQSQAHLRESVLPESRNPMFVRFAEEEDQFLANSTWSTRFATRNQSSQLDDLTDDYSPTLADKFYNLRLQPPQSGNNGIIFRMFDLIDPTDGEGGIKSGDVVDRFPSRGGAPLFTSSSGPRTGPHPSPQQQASRGADSLNPPDPSSQSQAHLRESVLPESQNPMFVRFAEEDQFLANSTWSTRFATRNQLSQLDDLTDDYSPTLADKFYNLRLQPPQSGNNMEKVASSQGMWLTDFHPEEEHLCSRLPQALGQALILLPSNKLHEELIPSILRIRLARVRLTLENRYCLRVRTRCSLGLRRRTSSRPTRHGQPGLPQETSYHNWMT
ncbi:unnamed protein product [Phaedon cochleariae]|uniref:Uncharacterized protein n=1 Tax=Phaedon cochleariae TaxID=80249 RepID=A0A9N9X3D1_PHACE|nr:unnamed protein product [Phaedon cochleariae]